MEAEKDIIYDIIRRAKLKIGKCCSDENDYFFEETISSYDEPAYSLLDLENLSRKAGKKNKLLQIEVNFF